MRIAFLTVSAPGDRRAFSGLSHAMSTALGEVCELVHVGPLPTSRADELRTKAAKAAARARGRRSLRDRDRRIVHSWGRAATRLLADVEADVVVSPSTLQLAGLEDPRPKVLWTDATFTSMLGFYPDFSRLTGTSLRQGIAVEREALARVELAVYSSTWAAKSAVEELGLPAERAVVVSFGSLPSGAPDRATALAALARRTVDRLELLLVGLDWHRKGCDAAIAAAVELRRRGVGATLRIVGCAPPPGTDVPTCVEIVGRIDGTTAAGRARMDEMRARAHVLLVPSIAECTALVVGEANAWAVPAVSTEVGGMADVVEHAHSGLLVSAPADGTTIADAVETITSDATTYDGFATAARGRFESTLSWPAASARLLDELALRGIG